MHRRLLAILFACGFPDVEAVLAKRDRAPADLQSGAVSKCVRDAAVASILFAFGTASCYVLNRNPFTLVFAALSGSAWRTAVWLGGVGKR